MFTTETIIRQQVDVSFLNCYFYQKILYSPAQTVRGFALSDLLDKPWSQVSSFRAFNLISHRVQQPPLLSLYARRLSSDFEIDAKPEVEQKEIGCFMQYRCLFFFPSWFSCCFGERFGVDRRFFCWSLCCTVRTANNSTNNLNNISVSGFAHTRTTQEPGC